MRTLLLRWIWIIKVPVFSFISEAMRVAGNDSESVWLVNTLSFSCLYDCWIVV